MDKRLVTAALMAEAARLRLGVHVWTVRPEASYADPRDGTMDAEVRRLVGLGVQGLFCDSPARCLGALAR